MRPLLSFTLSLVIVQGAATPQDYLPPELRHAVETLKADVARERSTNETGSPEIVS